MKIGDILPKELYDNIEYKNDITILYVDKDKITEILKFLKDTQKCEFNMLTDLSAVDYLGRELRWEVIYNLLSITENQRLIIKCFLEEDDHIESVSGLYSVAIWYEREVWDMYGIEFNNHPDMRRILSDYGFKGHPLRKDFPLTGYVEVKYDYESRKVQYEPIKLQQEFRNFDFLSPWEGPNYILPGDEKAK